MSTVLLIDDEPTILEVLTVLLELEGFRTVTARNGLEGLRQIAVDRPDLILLDMMMPIMNGRQTLEALRAAPGCRDIPVIAMSAADVSAAAEFGVDSIHKPFTAERLIEKVRRLLPNAG